MTQRLGLDREVVAEARRLAADVGQPIVELARTHTTVSVERAVLRLGGLDGAHVGGSAGLEHGVALPVWHAMVEGNYPDLATLARDATAGKVSFRIPERSAATAAAA